MANSPTIFVLDSNDNSRDIIKSYLAEYVQDDKIKAFSDYNEALEEMKSIENDKIAFEHPEVIVSGIARLKKKIEYTDRVFNMIGEYFTLGELQQIYEVILGKKLLAPAFRRIIESKVEKTDKVKTGGGHRPSVLFKYKEKKN